MTHRNRVESPWEMLLTYARAFTVVAASVEYSRGQINGYMLLGGTDPIIESAPIGQATKTGLDLLRGLCGEIASLNPVCFQIDRTLQKLSSGVVPLVLHTELENLQNRIMDELRNHFYYPVTAANAALYENEAPFGGAVADAFPSAKLEIIDAARCMILGQATASAFHLSRVLEVALRAFAKRFKIEYKPNWDAYMKAIQTKLDKSWNEKSASEKKSNANDRKILGDMMAVKLAWRNPTMHVERRYADHEAFQVFIATATLLEGMANLGIREKRRRASALPDSLPSDQIA